MEASARGSARVGALGVSEAGSSLSALSESVCDLMTAMAFEPVDWAIVYELYASPMDDDGGLSLRDAARGGTTVFSGRSDATSWEKYSEWLDARIMRGLNGTMASGETDDVRAAMVSNASRDTLGVALVLGFVEESLVALQNGYNTGNKGVGSGLEDAIEFVIKRWDAAWTVWHGYDKGDGNIGVGCAPWGTALRGSGTFGMAGDTNTKIQEAFVRGRTTLARVSRGRGPFSTEIFIKSDDIVVLQTALDEITKAIIVTYLRAAMRAASLMDASVANGQPANLRANQVAAIIFFQTIEPLVADKHMRATNEIAATLDAATGSSPVMPVLEPAIGVLLAAAGIDAELEFGQLRNE